MRFNKIVHPEIIMNKRGDSDARLYYKKFLQDIEYIEGVGFHANNNAYIYNTLDPIFVTHLCFCRKFLNENPKVYHIPKDFCIALSMIDNKIPINYLPDRFFAYISLPDETLKDEQSYVSGAYVYIGNSNETSLGIKQPNTKCLWISYVDDTKPIPSATNLGAPITESTTMKDLVASIEQKDTNIDFGISKPSTEVLSQREKIFRTLVNAVLYISSEDHKLEFAAPFKKGQRISKNQLKKLNKPINESSLPITLVNRHYHGRCYNIDESYVRGHFRWQQCGVNMSQVKLVWVREHIRKYKDPVYGINTDRIRTEKENS